MWSKCGSGGKCVAKLCPFSLGLAIGIVSFLAVLIWSLWVMNYGMPPMMAALHMPEPTLGSGFSHALLALIKGFVFGFFVALIYDCCVCCSSKKCDENCQCECGSPNKKMK
jgi:hypothetical protein